MDLPTGRPTPVRRATRPAPTRRQLLAGAIGLPTVVPASALGRGGHVAPGERIGVGFIGCGKMAFDYHIPSMLGFREVQALAACDVDAHRRERARAIVEQRYTAEGRATRSCRAMADFREALARPEIDAVVIATPEHWHAIPIIMACRAGKDVYCEKPLTLTLAESKAVVEVVRRHGRVLQTGSQQRSNVFGQFREACDIVRSGRLGRIRTVTVGVGGPSRWCDLPEEPAEAGLDWDLWLGCAPLRPYHSDLSPRGVHNHFPAWRSYREYAGGGHADMGAHHYDIAQWALDMDRSGPVEVIPPADVTTGQGVRFRYANGVEMTHGGPSGCVFAGTRGTLHIDRGVLLSDPADIAREPLTAAERRLPVSPGHHADWLQCVRTRRKPIADVEAGARTIAIVHLGNLAYWHQQRIRWDPRTWRFVGGSAPAEWLDRPRRAPWELPAIA